MALGAVLLDGAVVRWIASTSTNDSFASTGSIWIAIASVLPGLAVTFPATRLLRLLRILRVIAIV
jgi:hypothetical protein